MNFKRIIFVILLILWMGVIFAMSAKVAPESSKDSQYIGEMIGRIMVPGFNELSAKEQLEFAIKIEGCVRKLAHFIEYMILGILAAGAFSKKLSVRTLAAAAAFTVLYAASDEIHQLFVPGRSGQLSDVILDSTGGCVGVLVFLGIGWVVKRILRK